LFLNFAGVQHDNEEEEGEKKMSYHDLWRQERAREVTCESFLGLDPTNYNLKSSSSKLGGVLSSRDKALLGTKQEGGGRRRGKRVGRVTWSSDEEEGGGEGMLKVNDFLRSIAGKDPGAPADAIELGQGNAIGVGIGEEEKGEEQGQFVLPKSGFFGSGQLQQDADRYAASRMRWDDHDEAADLVIARKDTKNQEKNKEKEREERERARLSRLAGALNGDYELPPTIPAKSAHAAPTFAKGTATPHYSDFLRPNRPQHAGNNLYKNSGAPTSQNYDGRARAGGELTPEEEVQQEALRSSARAKAREFGGTFRHLHWDSSFKGLPNLRPCWFTCTFGHEFMASVSDLEKHVKVWSHINWCPFCEKKSKIKNAERFNGRPDNSWADFFERVDHIRPESHRFAEQKLAQEQADLFQNARAQVKDGTEKMEDWWEVDKDLPGRGGQSAAANAKEEMENSIKRTPAQEVERSRSRTRSCSCSRSRSRSPLLSLSSSPPFSSSLFRVRSVSFPFSPSLSFSLSIFLSPREK